jgi:hypothetical protein
MAAAFDMTYPLSMVPGCIHFFLSLGYKAETVLPDHYHHLDLICFAKYRESTKNAIPSPA